MSIRTLLIVAVVAALATGLAILAIDAPAARALAEVDPAAAPVRALDEILALLDEITLVRQPRGRLAAVLIVVGGLAWWWHRGLARAALVLGLTHAISRVGGSYLKEMFGRLRPGEALAIMHPDTYQALRAQALPMQVLHEDPKRVLVRKP